MRDYLYDGTFEGLLTCIYHHYYTDKAAGIYPRGEYQPSLLHGSMEVETDEEKADRVYNAINAALLPVSAGRLVGVVCDSFLVGLVSTVLAQRRLFTLPALGLYAAFIVLLVLNIRRKREGEAAFGALTLLSILGNVALVSLTIFCQARYTLYNMPMFYAGAFLLLRGALSKKTGVDKNGN